jgi:SAM-dependent methyltransferase
MTEKAISRISTLDSDGTNSRYGLWKYVIPLPPDSLMWSVGGQNLENFLVVADAWAQIVSRYTPANCRLLDIGSGCGRTARILVNNLYIAHYIGFDVIGANVAWCNKYIKPAFQDRACEFHHFDIFSSEYNPNGAIQASDFRFPCDDHSIDVTFAASVFTHLLQPDAEHYLCEIARVLRDRGTAVVSIHVEVAPEVTYQGSEARIDVDQEYFCELAWSAGLRCKDVIEDLAGQTTLILGHAE